MQEAFGKFFGIAVIAVVGFFIYSAFNRPEPPNTLINDSVTETVQAAAKKGYRPCTNLRCLNYSKKGWHHIRTPNYPDSYIWVSYGSMSYSQSHIGHLIDSVNGKATDIGGCPTCNGTGWIEKK